MKRRKTIAVLDLVERVNTYMRSPETTREQRELLSVFIESILHETGNYGGFNYLAWLNGGADQWREAGGGDTTPFLGDQTRRFYFYK